MVPKFGSRSSIRLQSSAIIMAVAAVLFIIVIILAFRLNAANKALEKAELNYEVLQQQHSALQAELAETQLNSGGSGTAEPGATGGSGSSTTGSSSAAKDWLDLSGVTNLSVKPAESELFEGFQDRYVTASSGLKLRGGPGTSYGAISTISYAEKVSAAASSGDWTFVKAGNSYGWVSSSYLSENDPKGGN